MRIEVTEILQNPGLEKSFSFCENEPSFLLHEQQQGFSLPLAVEGVAVSPGGKLIRAQGQIGTTLLLQCARCLKVYEYPLHLRFDEVFGPAFDPNEPERFLYLGNSVDITHMAVELLAVSLPVAPVCGEECLGLCTVCGADLALRPCDCDNQSGDM